MNILGISAFYHDSAASLINEKGIIAAAQEERFTRKKHDPSFPVNAIRYCLEESGLAMDELDYVVFYDKPFLKFERLLETYYHFAPRGVVSFIHSVPVWVKEKLLLKSLIYKELKKLGKYEKQKTPLLFSEHHLSHAASAFFPSPFDDAAILTIDGVGEWSTASVGTGSGNHIQMIEELHFPHSVGLLYSSFTYFLGFRVNSGEYKLMGLAPYGIPDHPQTKEFISLIYENLVEVAADGSVRLHPTMFKYATGLRMVPDRKWRKLFGFPRRLPEDDIKQHHCNLAYAIQVVTEDIVMKMVAHTVEITGKRKLCLAGGVALNCVANGKIIQNKLVDEIFIQPAAGDAGGALGAALAGLHIYKGIPREAYRPDQMAGAQLGPAFSNDDIQKQLKKFRAPYARYDSFDELASEVSRHMAGGKVVGWFQGRMEFGPRALGNRSIIADARNPEMQMKLNLKIKYRESFRPFAPSVQEEYAADYYELDRPSPYMLLVANVNEKRRNKLPADYFDLLPMTRLYIERSDVPAITHIDFSARIQTVNKETNPRYWKLIDTFREQTGCATIINTSFNVRGEPIVRSPGEAYRCFMNTEMDILVLGDCLLLKDQQPSWDEEKELFNFKPD